MRYILRRVALFVPTLFLVVTLVFILVRLIPGDVVTLLLHDQNVSPKQAEELRVKLGLHDSVPVQYLHYLRDIGRGDFGKSIWTGKSVAAEVRQRLPVTLELA